MSDFIDYGSDWSTSLTAACKRDDTVGAHVVTAPHDGTKISYIYDGTKISCIYDGTKISYIYKISNFLIRSFFLIVKSCV